MADINSCCPPTGLFTADGTNQTGTARLAICYQLDDAPGTFSGFLEIPIGADGQATGPGVIVDSEGDPVASSTQVDCPRDCFGDPVAVPAGDAPPVPPPS